MKVLSLLWCNFGIVLLDCYGHNTSAHAHMLLLGFIFLLPRLFSLQMSLKFSLYTVWWHSVLSYSVLPYTSSSTTDLKLSLYHEKYKSNSGKNTLLLLPGPYSLNGYRVRVYRQDSATQWFTGIITHHDLFSRNMVVMNDQVNLNKLQLYLPWSFYTVYMYVS